MKQTKCFFDCSGQNTTLFVSVTGGDSVTVTDVLLVEASGSEVVSGTIKSLGATDFLVNIDRIPEWAFVVQLKGLINDSTRSLPIRFQRQSPTQQQGSRVTITVSLKDQFIKKWKFYHHWHDFYISLLNMIFMEFTKIENNIYIYIHMQNKLVISLTILTIFLFRPNQIAL